MSEHFFRVRKVGEHWETEGLPSCHLGHELPAAQGNKPEGIFAQWSWDGSRLQVRNDRYGFYPLYYFARDGEIALSNSILKLIELGAPTELDDAALAVFLRLGFFLGEDTAFRAIRAVPPDASFEWKDGTLRVSGKLTIGKAAHYSRNEAINGYISLFRAAIRRRIPPSEDFAIPLSGGRDSRHILLELCEAGYRPRFCVTLRHFPPSNNTEAECASQVAAALDLNHVILDQPESQFQAEFRKNVKTSFCTDEHPHFMVLADYLEGKVRAAYDGIGGDILSAGLFLKTDLLELYQAGRPSELAGRLLGREAVLKGILRGEQHRRLSRELAVHHLARELAKHADAPNPVSSFYFWNRTRREIALAPYSILKAVPVVYSPYLDHHLYDFLASLPGSMFLDQQFHTDTIAKAFPHFATTPYASKTPEVQNARHFRRYARELGRHFLGRYPSHFVRGSYVLPRLLRCLLDRDYSGAIAWLAPLTVYLLQLESVINQPGAIFTTRRVG